MTQGMAALSELIGRTGMVDMEGLDVQVTVLNYKSAYGRVRLLVTPVSGVGERWIFKDRFIADVAVGRSVVDADRQGPGR